jgi:hypothetical protein
MSTLPRGLSAVAINVCKVFQINPESLKFEIRYTDEGNRAARDIPGGDLQA